MERVEVKLYLAQALRFPLSESAQKNNIFWMNPTRILLKMVLKSIKLQTPE